MTGGGAGGEPSSRLGGAAVAASNHRAGGTTNRWLELRARAGRQPICCGRPAAPRSWPDAVVDEGSGWLATGMARRSARAAGTAMTEHHPVRRGRVGERPRGEGSGGRTERTRVACVWRMHIEHDAYDLLRQKDPYCWDGDIFGSSRLNLKRKRSSGPPLLLRSRPASAGR